ncbi:MAG TPA: hypothetical protein VJ623_13705 [Holophagaceae bacterium]|nr:hypothetical protein [Holophagaceae bacterium]
MIRWFLFLTLAWGRLSAQEWAPIPASAWAIDGTSHPGARGAVILEDFTRYGVTASERRLTVRVFSEQGIQALELRGIGPDAQVQGRTHYRDGRISTFDGQKDLATRSISTASFALEEKVVIPPGVSSDCIVEVRWVQGRNPFDAWGLGRMSIHPLLRGFPVLKEIIDIDATLAFSTVFLGLGYKGPDVQNIGGYRRYVLEGLKGKGEAPFSIHFPNQNPVLFGWFQVPHGFEWYQKGIDHFWNMAGERIFKEIFKTGDLGLRYRALRMAICKDLPDGPSARAKVVLSRLEAQVRNASQLTYGEFQSLGKEVATRKLQSKDLDEAVSLGMTTPFGMELLFLQLLRDAGMEPKVFLAVDRDHRTFYHALPCINQFTHTLIGVEEPGKGFTWFQPSVRFMPPGALAPNFQGVQGMLMDLKDGSMKPFSISPQEASANRSDHEFSIRVGAEERFSYRATFQGFLDFNERRAFIPLEAKEQDRSLKERSGTKSGFEITKATVLNAHDASRNLEFQIEGSRELDGGGRARIHPFPLMPAPVRFPDDWPQNRFEPLVLPLNQIQSARSHLVAPTGWHWVKQAPIEVKGAFGTIQWTMTGEGRDIDVVLMVRLDRMFTPATEYQAFRAFIGGLKEAFDRTLILERTP